MTVWINPKFFQPSWSYSLAGKATDSKSGDASSNLARTSIKTYNFVHCSRIYDIDNERYVLVEHRYDVGDKITFSLMPDVFIINAVYYSRIYNKFCYSFQCISEYPSEAGLAGTHVDGIKVLDEATQLVGLSG